MVHLLRLIEPAPVVQGLHDVAVEILAHVGNAVSAAVAIVDAEVRAVPPAGRGQVLQHDVLVLHRGPEPLRRVHRGVEAHHRELELADAEEVVRLQPVALLLLEPHPPLLGRLGGPLAQVDVVAAVGVAHPQPFALLPALNRDATDCDVLARPRHVALRLVVELLLGNAVRSQGDRAALPSHGRNLLRLVRRSLLWQDAERQRVARVASAGPHLAELV
mmetsp:Transcript_93207/g.242739  ORF Transcript_93207/g.242739 Transcript_93207/m.242739 type:complete len:218 (-) Transcript_93207:104-757(-)